MFNIQQHNSYPVCIIFRFKEIGHEAFKEII